MEPEIRLLSEKKLIGKHLRMSLAQNKTFDLWRSFMQERKTINNAVGTELISMQVYDDSYNFHQFDPRADFDKWAAAEVSALSDIPGGMESYILPSGPYAVFLHKGPASEGPRTFQYIFGTWLPGSDYALDNRPHFELLGEKYKNDHPDSEEEIWIPIKKKV